MRKEPKKTPSTSWEPVQKWYSAAVGDEGHYYHQQIILPGVIRLLQLEQTADVALLDLACGQGILARALPTQTKYMGVDLSSSLIKEAKQRDRNPLHHYLVADVTKQLNLKETFSHGAILLALQNIEFPDKVFRNFHAHLRPDGRLVIVINHPCFRIPRQSSWQVDAQKKLQYRRVDRYMSEMRIPIHAHPSKGQKSETTWSFHHSLSAYSRWLYEAGFVIEQLEEWCSDKVSTGSAAKMENRSREEIPLFLALAIRRLP